MLKEQRSCSLPRPHRQTDAMLGTVCLHHHPPPRPCPGPDRTQVPSWLRTQMSQHPGMSFMCPVVMFWADAAYTTTGHLVSSLMLNAAAGFIVVQGIEAARPGAKWFAKWYPITALVGMFVATCVAVPLLWIPSMLYSSKQQPVPVQRLAPLWFVLVTLVALCGLIDLDIPNTWNLWVLLAWVIAQLFLPAIWWIIPSPLASLWALPSNSTIPESTKAGQNDAGAAGGRVAATASSRKGVIQLYHFIAGMLAMQQLNTLATYFKHGATPTVSALDGFFQLYHNLKATGDGSSIVAPATAGYFLLVDVIALTAALAAFVGWELGVRGMVGYLALAPVAGPGTMFAVMGAASEQKQLVRDSIGEGAGSGKATKAE